jgi:hypothetical protein
MTVLSMVSRGGGMSVVFGGLWRRRSVVLVAMGIMAGPARGSLGMAGLVMGPVGGRTVIVVAMVRGQGGVTRIVRAGGGRSMALRVMTGRLTRRVSGLVGSTLAHARTVPDVRALAHAGAVIVVRLVLVAHCYSVPQPLSAVLAAKSVYPDQTIGKASITTKASA